MHSNRHATLQTNAGNLAIFSNACPMPCKALAQPLQSDLTQTNTAMKTTLKTLAALSCLFIALNASAQSHTKEGMKQDAKEAKANVKEETKEAGQKTNHAMHKAGHKTKRGMQKAGAKMEKSMDKAGNKMEEKTN